MFIEPTTDAAGDAGQEYLVFTLDRQEYGIDILKVQEIRSFDGEGVTRIANAPEFVLGVMNLRGVIIPIVDMRVKFRLKDVHCDAQTVVVILNLGARAVGMVVDGVSDVLPLTSAQVSAAPQFGTTFATEYLAGIGTVGERMLILVDIAKLMTSAEMALVDEALTV